MNSTIRIFLVFTIALGSLKTYAHSTEDVESSLNEKERYAQFVNQPAPPFDLNDSDGNTLSLLDLRGKTR